VSGTTNIFQNITGLKSPEVMMRETEVQYHELLQGLPAAVYTCDANGYIELYNQAAVDLWGRTPTIGCDLWCGSWKIYHTDGTPLPLNKCPMAIALLEGRAVMGMEIIVERPDGSRRYVAPHPRPLFNAAGEVTGAINMLVDITDRKRSEVALRESEERLRIATLSSEVGTWHWSPLTDELLWDARCKELFGIATDAPMDYQRFIMSIHPDDRERTQKVIDYALTPHSGGYYDIEYRTTGSQGKAMRWLRAKGKAYFNVEGKTYRFSGTVQDITRQKEAEQHIRESEERFRLAAETAELATWDMDIATEVAVTSDLFRKILGYNYVSWTRNAFLAIVHPDDRPVVENGLAIALQSGRLFYEARILRPDKTQRLIRVNGKTFYDGSKNPVRLLGTLIDITDHRLAKDGLEKTVADQTRELRQANEKLEKSNRELEQFAYIASHDLQEPLRKIQTFASLLERNIENSTLSKKYFDKINSSALRMSVLIRDVLNYSRLAKDDDEFKETDLNEIVENVITDFELLIKEKEAAVFTATLPVIRGIPHQLHQLFSNLIGNSLKFTAANPIIHITSRKVSRPDLDPNQGYIQLLISDNGIGFEQKFAERIFTIFQRLNTRESYKGTGIGLALCKKIVENHRGIIEATSELGRGATFRIILPI
jgi:PAS domain S-box-containing protein